MPRCNDLVLNIKKNPIFCSNLGFGEQGAILKEIKSGILIYPDVAKAREMKMQLDALEVNAVLIDDFDKPFTLSTFSSLDNFYDLILAEYNLAFNDCIVISTPQILFTFLPKIEDFKAHTISLRKGNDYDIIEFEKNLVSLGYTKVESVTNKGEFSVRGDVVDVFNTISSTPIRLDFDYDNLASICFFDHLTYEKTEPIESVVITPNKLVFDGEKYADEFLNFKSDKTILSVIQTLNRGECVPLEFLAGTNNFITFKDLNLPIIISSHLEVETIYNKLTASFIERIENIFSNDEIKNFYFTSLNLKKLQKNAKKELNFDDFIANFSKFLIFFENFNIADTQLNKKIHNAINYDFKTVNFENFLYKLTTIKQIFKNYLNKKIFLCLDNASTLNSVKKILTENQIAFSLSENKAGLILTELKIPYNICFLEDDVFYIGSTNFAHKKVASRAKKSAVKYLPKAGEYVVHSTHGIGQCLGIVNISSQGVDKEYFKILYRNNDCLYVPYENADCLSLYMAEGASVKLNKLGGKEFYNEKLRAIKSIEDMSQELLELYAKRKASVGFKYSEDDYLYTEFENAFEYTETADQLQAIQDIKADMQSGKVMDRLICGDVGFGKTEVAMRALFKACENNKQVALLAPTTILSLQHFMTASKRVKDFGINVKMLNRFVPAKEQKEIIQGLKSGEINVVCGTHRLLGKDVAFKDLGLLILDEEQRFGVKAKEQIKNLKHNVDVLTLTATPIPRTLSMSLMNIRDISIINTPPANRLPVKTYVLTFDEQVVLNAINDELKRDGQVLIVYNNIEKLYGLKTRLEAKLNNKKAVFDIAHSKMPEHELEDAIKRLYTKQTNVFISTTLIENGVDLPMANTLIVLESDHMGLSQLYQLRGRVGRNDEQAYAYFTYPNKVLTEEASARLQAIAENTDLGSGFKIAMRDMQIRGAGELLGKVQHGHMQKIGYEMYTRLLNETLKRLRGENVEVEKEVKIDIALTSKIPSDFVLDEAERLKIISKISNITDKASHREVINSLLISYGKLPKEIYQLASIALLKALAVKNKVKQITLNKQHMFIVFYPEVNLDKLILKANKSAFSFEKSALPTISLSTSNFSVLTALNYSLEFLSSL